MPVLSILALGICLLASRPAPTAPALDPGGPALAVGYVDVQQLLQTSPVAATTRQEAERLKRRLQEQLAQQRELLFLSEADLKELKRLQNGMSGADQKAQIARLQQRSHAAEQEWRALQQTFQPSAAQKSRLIELSQLRSRNLGHLQASQQEGQKELQQRAGELMHALQRRILIAVEEVAAAEKLSLVVDKKARLYGGRDLTQRVTARLGGSLPARGQPRRPARPSRRSPLLPLQ